ncbi:MAG: hypothetical protein HRK26_05080 [Rickettsiaceae bacterium H1]|nr:hypothetical protein [Rickettsiaceae bacterium H1]
MRKKVFNLQAFCFVIGYTIPFAYSVFLIHALKNNWDLGGRTFTFGVISTVSLLGCTAISAGYFLFNLARSCNQDDKKSKLKSNVRSTLWAAIFSGFASTYSIFAIRELNLRLIANEMSIVYFSLSAASNLILMLFFASKIFVNVDQPSSIMITDHENVTNNKNYNLSY